MRFTTRSLLAPLFVALALLAPRASQACSVCLGGSDDSSRGFLIGTILLSTLPLLMVGGIVLYAWRRSRQR